MLHTAHELLGEREARQAGMVKHLGQAEADRRIRSARAIAKFWQHVVERTDFDLRDELSAFGATWDEMRVDLEAAATRAKELVAKAGSELVTARHFDPLNKLTPEAVDVPASALARDRADAIAALLWNHLPVPGHSFGLPYAAIDHDLNQHLRRLRAERRRIEGARKAA